GQVTMDPSRSPSPSGPPRWIQVLSIAWNAPSTLKTARVLPLTSATIPWPGCTSVVPVTRTNSPITYPRPFVCRLCLCKRVLNFAQQAFDRRNSLCGAGDSCDNFLCDLPERRRLGRCRIRNDDRGARIAAVANGRVDRHSTEKRNPECGGSPLPSSVRKYFGPLAAVAAEKVTHVLHNTEERYIHLLEHHHAFADIVQRDFLWCRNGDGAGQRDQLGEGELRVSCSRGQIDEQVIQFAPQHVSKKLLDSGMDHRTSPDYGGIFRDEKPHRDEFDTVTFSWSDLAVFLFRGLGHAHHHGNVRTIDICIEQADLRAGQGHGHSEINRDRRFADPAFAATDGNDIFDAGNEVVFPVTSLGSSGMFVSHLSFLLYVRNRLRLGLRSVTPS